MSRAAPRAAIVLVHGMGGFEKIDGIDYFWHVPALYRSLGATVIVPGTTTFASSEKRAAELKSKSKNTPFDGWTLRGGVAATIVGGRVVYVNDDAMKI